MNFPHVLVHEVFAVGMTPIYDEYLIPGSPGRANYYVSGFNHRWENHHGDENGLRYVCFVRQRIELILLEVH